ncbi:MAG: GAF domain-containing protein [Ferruginibacter sp.]
MVNTFNKELIPANDKLRLEALAYFEILNELPDRYFSNLAQIIALAFNSEIALVSLVGENDVYFKGNYGMEGTGKLDRGTSLCSLAILDPEPTIFNDAFKEPCLLSNPLVIGEFGLRFYAGAPIITSEGFTMGTVCIVGKEPREFSQQEKDLLILFAKNAMIELESRIEIKNKFSNI